MAPEVLRDEQTYFRGTQKGDVYAFAIILHEISMRQGPFYLGETSLIEPKGKKSNLNNIWQMSWQSHTLHHDQTKHPTENFISQNLFKIH